MAKNMCKLYLNGNIMFDIAKCETQLLHVHEGLISFLRDHAEGIVQYNNNICHLQ